MATPKEQHTIMLRPGEWIALNRMSTKRGLSNSELLGWLIEAQWKRDGQNEQRKMRATKEARP